MEASLLRPSTGGPLPPRPTTARSKLRHASVHAQHFVLRKNTRNRCRSTKLSSDSETDAETARLYRRGSSRPELLCGGFTCVGMTRDLLQPWVVNDDDSDASDDVFNVSRRLEMTSLQLCLLMLSVVKSLCQADQQRDEHNRLISAFIVPHLTRLLSSMTRETNAGVVRCSHVVNRHLNSGVRDGCISCDRTCDSHVSTNDESSSSDYKAESFFGCGWTCGDILFTERYMVRIMVMLVSYLCTQSNGIAVAKASGCLTSWLDIAGKCMQSATSGNLLNRESNSYSVSLASDIVNGLLLLLHAIFSSIPLNPSVLRMARDVFANFLSYDGLILTEDVILWLESHQVASDRTSVETSPSDLISAVGKVIVSLKLAKIDYIHTLKCTKRKHRKCDFDVFFHHHNDILNIESTDRERRTLMGSQGVGMSDDATSDLGTKTKRSECAVAIFGHFLQRLFDWSQSRCVKLCILSCVEDAGFCCCMSPCFAQSMLLDSLEDQPAVVRHRMLHVFTKVVLHQLGGAATAQRCSGTCVTCADLSSGMTRDALTSKQETSDSAFSGSDMSLHEDEPLGLDGDKPKWHCVKRLLPLVLNSNHCLAIQTMQHLLHLVRWGSPVLLYQLFQHVFLPVMHASQHSETTHVSGRVTHYCLVALPLLLRTPQTYDLFLNYSGVKQLWQLSQIAELRPCVLRVFQVLIELDDQVVDQDCDIYDAISSESLHSRDSLMLDMFLQMVLSDCEEFTSKTTVSDNDAPSAEQHLKHSDWLAAKGDQWSSCDSLFAQSRKFRHCFIERNGAQIAYDTLTRSLSVLSEACDDDVVSCHYEGEDKWFWQCLLLVQSTLDVCLACCHERALFGNSVSMVCYACFE